MDFLLCRNKMAEFSFSSKSKLTLKEFEIVNTSDYNFAAHFAETGKQAQSDLKVEIVKIDEDGMFLEFDMIGYDPSVANAVRRILLSDVPTMAIEKVHIYQNTSIMQDEVLAHRMGLIPLKADPRLFKWKEEGGEDEGTEEDTLEFSLHIKCRANPDKTAALADPYVNSKVFTQHMKWVPKGKQADKISSPGPVEDDILLNKLRPGHEMEMKLFAVKGVGRDHAKFSPVATAFYRLHPEIKINKDIYDDDALRLLKSFTPGVIQLEPTQDGRKKAVVIDARNDMCCRNIFRHEDLKDAVTLEKRKDHFIFNVESTGAVKSTDLVTMALDVLLAKCDIFIDEIDAQEKKE
jgi:DNA-directed RNA polymerase I and III subunit RPAC1